MPNASVVNVDGVAVSKAQARRVPVEPPDVVVRHLIGEHLGVDADKVTEDATFREDLGADSLDAFDLLMALEERFGIEIPDKAADSMSCVGDAVAYIEAHALSADTRRTADRAPDSHTRQPR